MRVGGVRTAVTPRVCVARPTFLLLGMSGGAVSDYQADARELAVLTAVEQGIAARKAVWEERVATLRRGTVVALDDLDQELGKLVVPKPTTPKPVIVDEAAAVGWAIGEFGEYAAHMRLSDIGKTDVLAAYARGVAVPGVEQPLARPGTPRFTPSRDVVALVQGMVSRGVLTAADLPMIGGA